MGERRMFHLCESATHDDTISETWITKEELIDRLVAIGKLPIQCTMDDAIDLLLHGEKEPDHISYINKCLEEIDPGAKQALTEARRMYDEKEQPEPQDEDEFSKEKIQRTWNRFNELVKTGLIKLEPKLTPEEAAQFERAIGEEKAMARLKEQSKPQGDEWEEWLQRMPYNLVNRSSMQDWFRSIPCNRHCGGPKPPVKMR